MFRVEKMEHGDFPFAVELANTMNWNMTLEDFDFNAKLEPQGCFILLHGSERIGIATCISYGRIGWFGNLIVKPEYRRKGAGTLLMKHAIDYLRSSSAGTIGLYAYPHLTGFYERLGFRRNADFAVLKAQTVSSKPEMELKRLKKQDLQALVDFDSRCFGASRRKLLEPILLDIGNLAFFSAEGNQIDGYVAAKIYKEMAEVGPLVCRRNRRDSAVPLLKAILGKLGGFEVWMYVSAAETALIGVAEKAGFREEFRVARMFLGSVVAEDCVYLAESLERG